MHKNRITNRNFYEEYKYFDFLLCKHFKIEENGVIEYMKRMKEAVIDVRDIVSEWDSTYERLQKIKERYDGLDTSASSFDEFLGKDEDVVWIRIFLTKIDSGADPLSKYAKIEFTYKKRPKSFMQKIMELFK